MFGPRYFGSRHFGRRYWGRGGAAVAFEVSEVVEEHRFRSATAPQDNSPAEVTRHLQRTMDEVARAVNPVRSVKDGGTGLKALGVGEVLFAAGPDRFGRLAPKTDTVRRFLRSVGSGAAPGYPEWDVLVDGDIPAVLSANARVAVQKAGVAVGTRRTLNLIQGSGATVTVADDAGNERVNVTIAASGLTTVRQPGDVTNATTSLADITGLVLPLAANTLYFFELAIRWQTSDITVGAGFSLDGPASPSFIQWQLKTQTSTTADNTRYGRAYGDVSVTGSLDLADTPSLAIISGLILNGSNAGNLIGRFRAEVATATITALTNSVGFLLPVP